MTSDIPVMHKPLPMRQVLETWWPLAISWLLMSLELPALSAVIARLENPEINLAAYGGVVFPIALIIEAPIIMLLAASTALSKDWASYLKLRNYMIWAGASLTLLHIAIAFTPLYDWVVAGIIGAPTEIVEPARIGLMIMTPWTWSIAYRRFNQGVLIRFGHSRAISIGTLIRLGTDILILMIGYAIGSIPGIVVATSAVAASVIAEAVYVAIRIRPVRRDELQLAPPIDPPLTYRAFAQFYIPLALTSLLTLLVQPLGSAALSRMPQALESLAVWPVITGLIFLFRSLGIALNEVVVALLDEPLSSNNLWRFTKILATGTTVFLLVMVLTPLAEIWFRWVSALSPELTDMAVKGLWFALPMPAMAALQSWYQGSLLQSKKTNGIPEAVAAFLGTIGLTLWIGVVRQQVAGLYMGLLAFTVAMFVQTIWLWYRSRPALSTVFDRDQAIETQLRETDFDLH
jgi:hypothetical protein